MKKQLFFITGLPRSGTTLISSILKQNLNVHSNTFSSLSSILSNVNSHWLHLTNNQNYADLKSKKDVLKSIISGYYEQVDTPIIFDRNLEWISQINLLESLLDYQVKMLVCVRNPAEILSSFEKMRKETPLLFYQQNENLNSSSSIASRAYFYAGNEGALGSTHRQIKDAITMGYIDRLLFVDYNRFCNTPKAQLSRIYDFFEISKCEHNLNNIESQDTLSNIKTTIDRSVHNCVEYLGIELYDQYNREIFWNAWI
jgi:sulfotransferase